MLSFSVTICPYHQRIGPSGLIHQILLYSFLVGVHGCLDWGIKEFERIASVPLPVRFPKIATCQMTGDTCDRIERVSLRIVEFIVLYVLVSSGMLRK